MSAPQLVLLTPETGAPDTLPLLELVLAAAPFAAVILDCAGDDDQVTKTASKLVPAIQKAGAAALIRAPRDTRIVGRSGADGAFYRHDDPLLKDALDLLKPKSILGVGGLRTRHDAMEIGDSPIDFLMFGEQRADGSIPEVERVIERVQWWAEIFTVPCVAYAASLDVVAPLAATGADFLALGPWLFESADPAATLREVQRLLASD